MVTIDEPEINSWIAREGQMSLGPLWIGATDVVNWHYWTDRQIDRQIDRQTDRQDKMDRKSLKWG